MIRVEGRRGQIGGMRDGDEGEEVRRSRDGGNEVMAMAMMMVTVTEGVMLVLMV